MFKFVLLMVVVGGCTLADSFSFPKSSFPYPNYLTLIQVAPKGCQPKAAYLHVVQSQEFFDIKDSKSQENTYEASLECSEDQGEETQLQAEGNFFQNLQNACKDMCGEKTCLFNATAYVEGVKTVYLKCSSSRKFEK